MRLEGMGGLRYSAADADLSDVDLRSRVVRIIAKGRREMILPIGMKAARDIDRYVRARAAHPHAAGPWLWLTRINSGTFSLDWQIGRIAYDASFGRSRCIRSPLLHARLIGGSREQDTASTAATRARAGPPVHPAEGYAARIRAALRQSELGQPEVARD